MDDAQIECYMVRKGGKWKDDHGREFGNGLFFHYHRLFRLYWSSEDDHRWEQESLKAILDNQFSTLMGCSGSTKTSTASKFALCFYSVWPDGTTILISSTDMRGLEMRVFGRIKQLHEDAKNRYDWFPGHVIDSKKVIATDDIEDGARDLRDGITCIPCLSSSGSFVGLGKYIGIHNTRLLFIGDEFQLMQSSILDAVPNLLNNPYSKFIFLGNPLAQNDPLDRVSEPKEGWGSVGIPKKTIRWNTKYMNGICLNLPGLDSPNYDRPENLPDRYSYMVGRYREKLVRESYGEGSTQYCSQILGVRVEGLTARKVITREICEKFDAFRLPIWDGTNPTIKVYAVDAAYGSIGGDLCVGGSVEFGKDSNGKMVICIGPQRIIPVSALSGIPPDDQIALYVKQECEVADIPEENVFFDGRTMLMAAFARLWNGKCKPVDFGAQPTSRPVSLDMKILDENTGVERLKLCHEHYSKFVSELWFALRYAIESGQICGMTEDILADALPREFKTVRGNKVEIESKTEMRKRTGKSPDRTDQIVTALEGCRRLGFQISKLAQPTALKSKKDPLYDWLKEMDEMNRSKELQGV